MCAPIIVFLLADESAREQNQDEEHVSSDSETNGKRKNEIAKNLVVNCHQELNTWSSTVGTIDSHWIAQSIQLTPIVS